MNVPVVRGPACFIRQQRQRVFHLTSVLFAELLTKFGRADRTYLYTLSTGYAVFFFYMRTICGTGHIWGIVELRGADRIADTGRTVAESNDFIFAVNICRLMDKAMPLRPLAGLQRLLLCNIMAAAGIHAPLGEIAKADAALLLDGTVALSADPLLPAAGADTDGKLALVFIQPV